MTEANWILSTIALGLSALAAMNARKTCPICGHRSFTRIGWSWHRTDAATERLVCRRHRNEKVAR